MYVILVKSYYRRNRYQAYAGFAVKNKERYAVLSDKFPVHWNRERDAEYTRKRIVMPCVNVVDCKVVSTEP